METKNIIDKKPKRKSRTNKKEIAVKENIINDITVEQKNNIDSVENTNNAEENISETVSDNLVSDKDKEDDLVSSEDSIIDILHEIENKESDAISSNLSNDVVIDRLDNKEETETFSDNKIDKPSKPKTYKDVFGYNMMGMIYE